MRKAFPRSERPYRDHAGVWADEFRCDASYENWRSRGTVDRLLIFTVSGMGRVGTADAEVESGPGTVTVYEPGASQFYYTDPGVGKWHLLWAHFHPRPHWNEWLAWPRVTAGLRACVLPDAAVRRRFRAALSESIRQCRERGPGSEDLAVNALERALIVGHAADPLGGVDPRVRRAAELLRTEMREPFSLAVLAAKCGLSASRLIHLFTRQIGTSPQQYLEDHRLRRASHLLRSSGMSVSEAAAETGYANAFYFSNRFKKKFGLSPSAFRELREGSRK